MTNIIFGIYIFLDILYIIVIIDVILSWIGVFGINLRPQFIADIIDPMYNFVKKIIPTNFGPFDFTPIVIVLFLYFLKGILIIAFPEVQTLLQLYQGII